ncbi:MAG: hypothetical protein LH461_04170 [Spirochaetaceae bacterium]|nr:hypothetical protein [Spirochaetaceae bacterium]
MKPPEVKPYAEPHLPGVLFLCREQGWSTYVEDAARTHRALTAHRRGTGFRIYPPDDQG